VSSLPLEKSMQQAALAANFCSGAMQQCRQRTACRQELACGLHGVLASYTGAEE